jgi:soluble lytic murein transglycosylase-like protein
MDAERGRTHLQAPPAPAAHRPDPRPLLLLAALLLLIAGPLTAAPTEPPDPELKRLLKQAAGESDSFVDRFDAEVWLMDMSGRLAAQVPDPRERIALLRAIHAEAKRAGLAPELVLAVIEVESNFDRFAISSSGARGLMQIMPFWLDEIGRDGDNLFHVHTNLRYGCTILRYYMDMEQGRLSQALARYNGSSGRWDYPMRVYRALDRRWYAN